MEKFFIVGCPRSGTTMVQQALNRHSQIVIPPETKFFFSFLGHSRDCQLRHLDRLNADLQIRIPEPACPVRSVSEGRALFDQIARLYVKRLGKKGVACFGEKTPEHTGHLPRIQKHFPDAKIIVLSRDGRDVATSLSRMPWMPSDLYVNFLVWLRYTRILGQARRKARSNFYYARYEDIVAAPKDELGRICRFLGLHYEPAVALGFGNKEGIPEREYPWKRRALRRITSDRVGVFRDELDIDEIETLERLGRRVLPSLGYPLLSDGRRPLSATFMLRLSWNLAKSVYALPWHLVAHELCGRSLLCCPGRGPAPTSRVPVPPISKSAWMPYPSNLELVKS
jgi:hypothetical protein